MIVIGTGSGKNSSSGAGGGGPHSPANEARAEK